MFRCESISETPIHKAKILLAEDDRDQACTMKDCLEQNGHDVLVSEDAGSLVESVRQYRPDVILIDRDLQNVNSTTVCRSIKRNSDTSGIPIIVLAEQLTVSDKVAGLSAGADDLISKPFDDEELNALICARLRSKAALDDLWKKTRDLQQMLTKVEAVAHVDPLTGLYNRRRFESVLAVEFKRAARYKHPLSCLMLDLDHFKHVNDHHGHLAGDDVLRKTAQIIQQTIREIDVAARWGGEEFIILTPETEMSNALIAAEKLRTSIAQKVAVEGQALTASIGVAGIPHPAIESPLHLVHAADLALYEAKRRGRNRVCSTLSVREQ